MVERRSPSAAQDGLGAEEVRTRLETLRARLPAAVDPDLLRRFAELETAVEALEVADQELAVQNEELAATQEALEGERRRYRELFEAAPDGYLVTDLAGVVHEANEAACRLLNVSRRGLSGKPLAVFVGEAHRAAFRALLPRLAGGERVSEWEIALERRGGERFPAALSAGRERGAGGQRGELRWLLRDVSQRKAAESELREIEERLRHAQRLEAIGRLAGGIAHSFNNLLAAIAFHGELLAAGVRGDERLAAHAGEVLRAGERAASLASQLLAFSRKQVLRPRPLDVGEAIAAMRPMLAQLLGEDVRLTTHLERGAGCVEADLAQLEQVVLNLAVNARDAMPYGGELTLAAAPVRLDEPSEELELPAGDYLQVTVRDTGAGMSQDVLAHVFEPFFTTKEPHRGTGLGLATVYGIVRQSGGGIRVASEPGAGTTFEIYLPLRRGERPQSEPASLECGAEGGSEVVLLVEDEESIRLPVAEVLESRGYTVLAAADGHEALEVAAGYHGAIDLMVTDVVMPGMSGSELAEQLTRSRPELKVLFVSGYPASSIAHRGRPHEHPYFLQKPFAPAVLLDAVRRALDSAA